MSSIFFRSTRVVSGAEEKFDRLRAIGTFTGSPLEDDDESRELFFGGTSIATSANDATPSNSTTERSEKVCKEN
jgi:hypothetical protein